MKEWNRSKSDCHVIHALITKDTSVNESQAVVWPKPCSSSSNTTMKLGASFVLFLCHLDAFNASTPKTQFSRDLVTSRYESGTTSGEGLQSFTWSHQSAWRYSGLYTAHFDLQLRVNIPQQKVQRNRHTMIMQLKSIIRSITNVREVRFQKVSFSPRGEVTTFVFRLFYHVQSRTMADNLMLSYVNGIKRGLKERKLGLRIEGKNYTLSPRFYESQLPKTEWPLWRIQIVIGACVALAMSFTVGGIYAARKMKTRCSSTAGHRGSFLRLQDDAKWVCKSVMF